MGDRGFRPLLGVPGGPLLMDKRRDRQRHLPGDVPHLPGRGVAGCRPHEPQEDLPRGDQLGPDADELARPHACRRPRGRLHLCHHCPVCDPCRPGRPADKAQQLAAGGLGDRGLGRLHQRHVLEPQLLGLGVDPRRRGRGPGEDVPTGARRGGRARHSHVSAAARRRPRRGAGDEGLDAGLLLRRRRHGRRQVARCPDGCRGCRQPARAVPGGDVQRLLSAPGDVGAGDAAKVSLRPVAVRDSDGWPPALLRRDHHHDLFRVHADRGDAQRGVLPGGAPRVCGLHKAPGEAPRDAAALPRAPPDVGAGRDACPGLHPPPVRHARALCRRRRSHHMLHPRGRGSRLHPLPSARRGPAPRVGRVPHRGAARHMGNPPARRGGRDRRQDWQLGHGASHVGRAPRRLQACQPAQQAQHGTRAPQPGGLCARGPVTREPPEGEAPAGGRQKLRRGAQPGSSTGPPQDALHDRGPP
mmetsp:Transcript_37997/g.90263  ORF Transcript_37997/g.90263 Transcript_37997/m.90263 type:complete len:470 (-) Transcript_37997:185-1594(-)